jgi:AhpD family alkylhydroperoxidase
MKPEQPSRIPADPAHRFPWYVRLFLANQRRRYGTELEPARLWARTPKVFAALSLLYGALDRRRSPIEPALRSLLTVRVSQINWCAFCVDINSATGRKRGISEEQFAALENFATSALFDERQKAALAYAEAMTRTDAGVDDDLMARVKTHFDDDSVIELTAIIAFQNMSSKFNAALDVAPQGFCRTPQK